MAMTKNTAIVLFVTLAVLSVGLIATSTTVNAVEKTTTQQKSIDDYYAEPLPTHPRKDVASYEAIKEHIREDLTIQRELLEDDSLTQTKKDRINREIERLEKLEFLATLRQMILTDPDNAEKYHEQGVKIMETLVEEYKDVIVPGQKPISDPQIKQVFHEDTYVDTNPVYRYHCDAGQNLPGWFDADVDTHYPTGSDWDSVWHYPIDATNSGNPTCIEYDHSQNVVQIIGPYPFACNWSTATEDFRDEFYCSVINHSTTVGIYANAKYIIGGFPQDYASASWDVHYLN